LGRTGLHRDRQRRRAAQRRGAVGVLGLFYVCKLCFMF
jgi:hypothetical protein